MYLDSELALYDIMVAIRDTWPALDINLHQVLVDLGVWSSVIGLATHDNPDIAGAAVATMAEIVDADECAAADSAVLAEALLENDAVAILAVNMFRLKTGDVEDEKGVAATLQVRQQGVVEDAQRPPLCSHMFVPPFVHAFL